MQTTAMTMEDFLHASRGTWMTRRAVHHLDHQDDEFADSNLIIEPFNGSDPAVATICTNLGINAAEAQGGARFWWESNLKQSARSDDHAAVLIDVPSATNPREGFLLRDKGYVEKQSVVSTYAFADDGVLTITTRSDTNVGIERCWFVTDQVRMRVSSVQCLNGVAMTTYCTELRCPTDEDIQTLAAQARANADAQQSLGIG